MWIFDLATGFARSIIINSKTAQEVSKKLISNWYGAGYPSIAENLMAREVANSNYFTIRMQQKFCHAILSKVRPTHDRKHVGSWVWFKRSNEKEWREPVQLPEAMKGQISAKVGRYYYPARHEDCFRLTKSQIEKLQLDLELTEPDLINAVVKPVEDEKRTDTEILTEFIHETIPLCVPGPTTQEPEAIDSHVAANPPTEDSEGESPGLDSRPSCLTSRLASAISSSPTLAPAST